MYKNAPLLFRNMSEMSKIKKKRNEIFLLKLQVESVIGACII